MLDKVDEGYGYIRLLLKSEYYFILTYSPFSRTEILFKRLYMYILKYTVRVVTLKLKINFLSKKIMLVLSLPVQVYRKSCCASLGVSISGDFSLSISTSKMIFTSKFFM